MPKPYTFLLLALWMVWVIHGSDDARRPLLLVDTHADIDDAVTDIFDPFHQQEVDIARPLITGSALGAGTAYMLTKLAERPPSRFVDPFTVNAASGVASELLKAGPALAGSLVAAIATWKLYKTIRDGIIAQNVVPIQKDFERLKEDQKTFKDAMKAHQADYEKHTAELVERRLQAAEQAIKDLLRDWFVQIDTTNSQVMNNLTEQERLLQALKDAVPNQYHAAITEILEKNAQSTQLVSSMHKISPETLEKYSKKHKKSGLAGFFQRIFHSSRSNH